LVLDWLYVNNHPPSVSFTHGMAVLRWFFRNSLV
jgi:hypothetical protein